VTCVGSSIVTAVLYLLAINKYFNMYCVAFLLPSFLASDCFRDNLAVCISEYSLVVSLCFRSRILEAYFPLLKSIRVRRI
jgi:hypothetical protein